MKRFLKFILAGAFLVILPVLGLQVYRMVLEKQVAEQGKLIQEVSDRTHLFTLRGGRDPYEAIAFDIATPRDVQLHTWATGLMGSMSVSVVGPDGESVFHETAGPARQTHTVHLEAGHYRVMTQFSNTFGIGGAVGVSYASAYLAQLPVRPDTDLDGLPDKMEMNAGTDPSRADTDGDSVNDYAEAVKYKSNPLDPDSDGDGAPDSDWDERRERVYTARVLMKLRQPFDLEAMNDLYQDVRVVEGPDGAGYTRIEAVIYPETQVVLNASAYPLEDLPDELLVDTQPGIATNYDAEMQAEVLDIVAGSTTDVQAAKRILDWVNRETFMALDYSIPEVYFTTLDDGQVSLRNYHDKFPAEDLLRTHYFASSMFAEKTHGTCTSIATLKCAMLKAAGIPCRVIQTLFPIYYHASQTEPYENNLSREWECAYEQPAGDDVVNANHAFMEVYLGQQWVRVDDDLGIYQQNSRCMSLKFVAVADWSEVDFSETWPTDWIHDRPYYTSLIEDQEPQVAVP